MDNLGEERIARMKRFFGPQMVLHASGQALAGVAEARHEIRAGRPGDALQVKAVLAVRMTERSVLRRAFPRCLWFSRLKTHSGEERRNAGIVFTFKADAGFVVERFQKRDLTILVA